MPKVRPVGHASLSFHHTGAGVTGEMVNTLDVDFSGLAAALTQSVLDSVSDLWAGGPHARHCGTVLYTKVTAIVHQPDDSIVSMESTHGSIAGSGGTDVMPLSVAVIVQKTTPLAGRSFRGRWFFGGFALSSAATADPNMLDASFVTPFQTACSDFLSAMQAANVVPELLHTGAHPPTAISSLDVHALVGTVRKRIR